MPDTTFKVTTEIRKSTKRSSFETDERGVRLYSSSPHCVCVQIRGTIANTPCIAMANVGDDTLKAMREWIDTYFATRGY